MAQKKSSDEEAVDQVVGFLTSTKGMVTVGVLLLLFVGGIVWGMF